MRGVKIISENALNRAEKWALISFLAYIFLIPLRPVMGGLHSPVRTLLLAVLGAYLLLLALSGRFRKRPSDLPFFFFSLIMALSAALSFDPGYSLSSFFRTLVPMLVVYVAAPRVITDDAGIRAAAVTVVASSVLVILLGFLFPDQTSGRMEGIFKWPTRLGKYLDLVIPVSIALALSQSFWPLRLLSGSALTMQMAALFSSGTRGALIGLAAACTPFVFMKRRLLPLAAAAAAAAALFMAMAPESLTHRQRVVELVTNLPSVLKEDEAMMQRFHIYRASWLLIRERPILGWGYGNHIEKRILKKRGYGWLKAQGIEPPVIYHAHNLILEIVLEGGLAALAAALWLAGSIAAAGLRLILNNRGPGTLLGAGFFLGLTALAIHSIITVPQWANSSLAVSYMGLVMAARELLISPKAARRKERTCRM